MCYLGKLFSVLNVLQIIEFIRGINSELIIKLLVIVVVLMYHKNLFLDNRNIGKNQYDVTMFKKDLLHH